MCASMREIDWMWVRKRHWECVRLSLRKRCRDSQSERDWVRKNMWKSKKETLELLCKKQIKSVKKRVHGRQNQSSTEKETIIWNCKAIIMFHIMIDSSFLNMV